MEKDAPEKKTASSHDLRKGFVVSAIISIALMLVIGILATAIAYRSPMEKDLTASGVFTLSDGTLEVLDELKDDVRIGAVYADGQEETIVKELLKRYTEASDHIKVEYLDVQKDPSALAAYQTGDAQTIANGTLIINGQDRYKLLSDDTMIMTGSDGTVFYGEQDITGAIRYVSTDELPILYATTGHGEVSLTDMDQAVSLIEGDAFEIRQLSLMQTDIPKDASVLMIASPQNDLTEYEAGMLSDYLAGGGRLLLMTDPILSQTEMSFPNLNSVLVQYGLSLINNYVVEGNEAYHLSNSELFVIPRYGDHEVTRSLIEAEKMVVLPIAMAVSSTGMEDSSLEQTVLLASTSDSWAHYDLTKESTEKTEQDASGPLPLAYAVSKTEGNTQSRLIVIGDSTFAIGTNVDAQANGAFLVSALDWLHGSKVSASVPGKVISSGRLMVKQGEFKRIAIACCALLPAIMFICAGYLAMRRKNR
ncbi:MAG: GldG family protein [Eubacterium sp.]|nr:GldG family protein [Eubacterium sp.]